MKQKNKTYFYQGNLLKRRLDWLKDCSPDEDVVITSRLRLARNLARHKFPTQNSADESAELLNSILEKNLIEHAKKTSVYYLPQASELSLAILLERRLVDGKMIQSDRDSASVVFKGEAAYINVNCDDHLHFHAVAGGRNILKAYKRLQKIYKPVLHNSEFSRHPLYGYLTSSPTNIGCGLRVSLFCHLPALVTTGRISKIAEQVLTAGAVIKGLFGNPVNMQGEIFELFNQATLGVSESIILDRMEKILQEVIDGEREARAAIIKEKDDFAVDSIKRSLAVLQNAHLLSEAELFFYYSTVKFGCELGWIEGVDMREFLPTLLYLQSGHLSASSKISLNSMELDKRRAEIISHSLRPAKLVHNLL